MTCQHLFLLHQSVLPSAPKLVATAKSAKRHGSVDYPLFGFSVQLNAADQKAGMYFRPESGGSSRPWLIVQDRADRLIQKGNTPSRDLELPSSYMKQKTASAATRVEGGIVEIAVDTFDNSTCCGKRHLVWPVASNIYGMKRGETEFLAIQKTQKRAARRYYCFEESTKIPRWINSSGKTEYCNVNEIKIGDTVLAANGLPTTVQEVQTTIVNDYRPMVAIGDFYITPGHPVMYQDQWIRPDQLYPKESMYITTLYNFYCTPHHALVIGRSKWICSSLGNYCPGLAEIDPLSDILYGSGYGTEKAKRYEWLLSRAEQVPIKDLEAETDAYWKAFNENDESNEHWNIKEGGSSPKNNDE